MRSNSLESRDAVFAAVDRLEFDTEALGQLSFDTLTELDCVSVPADDGRPQNPRVAL